MNDKKQERVGVYVCHCGSNIAGTVDVVELTKWAEEKLKHQGVVVAREYKFMCSSLGQELIEKDIKELGLTRVVVAACSPHLHEKTFRTAAKNAGLNLYLCELASIREQVSWVHTDKAVATAKAKAVVSGAVSRVIENVPLEEIKVPINANTLVVGGGIAGIQSALEIANAGFHVYLVEREPSLGGHMAQFDKTFPTLDCSACILTPRMVEAGTHPNITLLTWSAVGQRRRRRLVDDAHHLQARDLARVLGGLPLRVIEVGGHGNDRPVHLGAQVVLRRLLHLLQDHRRDLGGRVLLALDLDRRQAVAARLDLVGDPARLFLHFLHPASHEPLDGEDGLPRVGDGLPLGHLTHQPLAVLGEGHDRRGRPAALRVGNDDGI